MGDAAPVPCTSRIRVSAGSPGCAVTVGSGVGSAVGVGSGVGCGVPAPVSPAEFVGVGAPAAKSAELSSVSAPAVVRAALVLFFSSGAGAPS